MILKRGVAKGRVLGGGVRGLQTRGEGAFKRMMTHGVGSWKITAGRRLSYVGASG